MININIDKSNKCNGDWSLYVTFPYDEKIVDVIRGFSSRYWDKDKKQWEVPLSKLSDMVENLSDYEFDISGTYVDLTPKVFDVPKDFSFKTTPFKHQIEGFNFGVQHERWLLGDEQGLGKTKQVIDIAVAKKLENQCKHCLIICGVNGLKWNWKNEIKTHSNESGWILGQRFNKSGKLIIGSNKDKLEDLNNLSHIKDYFLITNVETLRDEVIKDKLANLCSTEINMVAIDEIHKCKNPSSQQGKGILKLQPKYRIAMTGTPLLNTPLDLFIILKWLGYEKHSYYQFKNHHCIMGGYGNYQIMGYRYLEDLQEQLNDIMLRRLKKDVLDLPEKLRIDEYVEMTPKQAKLYNEIELDIKTHIDQIKMANNPLAELIRLRQATGYTGILSSTIKESAKLDRMEELVEEAVGNGKQVVIFSNWTQMTDIIRARLAKKYKGVVITGQTNDAERQVNVNHFQNNNDCKYIIGTIGAMGTGLTLTAGTVEIFMDEPWNRGTKEQAEDRCHRVGTTENITIYTLICKDTIDEKINNIVMQKGEMADALVDGKCKIDNSQLLEYLLN